MTPFTQDSIIHTTMEAFALATQGTLNDPDIA